MSSLREDRLRSDLAEIAELSRPAELHDRVLRASRRSRARTAVVAVAVITVVAAGLGLAVWRRSTGPVLPVGPLQPVILPRGDIPVMWPSVGSVVRDQRVFSEGTLDVPTWPGMRRCPSGALRFRYGQSTFNSTDHGVLAIKALRADVDHDGSEELLVHLACVSGGDLTPDGSLVGQVVAYSGDRVLGRVVASPPNPNAPFVLPGERDIRITDVSAEGDGRVRVDWLELSDVTGTYGSTTSTRMYGWNGDRFTQIGDATELQGPTGAELSIEAGGGRGVDPLGQAAVTLDVTVRNAGRVRSAPLRLAIVVPAHLHPAGAGWDGCRVPLETPLLNLTPSPVEYNAAVALVCPAPAVDAGGSYTRRFHFLQVAGPVTPRPTATPDESIPPAPRVAPDAPVLQTISVEVDQQPHGEYERDRTDNTVQFPMP
jgi:hypothetical protein